MERYDWLAGRSAPPGSPIYIGSSSFHYRGGGTLYIPPGPLWLKQWGGTSDVDIVGPDLKRLPDGFDVTYYSALEDKLYRGDFPLPYERIAKLFKLGYQELQTPRKAHATYDTIIAGMAPDGEVAVWLCGLGRQTEVFFGRAAESAADWHDALRIPTHVTRAQRRESMLAELKPKGAASLTVPETLPGGFARLHKRYAWRPVLENIDPPPYLRNVRYYNGEVNDIILPELQPPDEGRAVPSSLTYYFTRPMNGKTILFSVAAHFDRDEVVEAFERLGRQGEQIEVVLRRDAPGQEATELSLRTPSETLRLSRSQLEVRPLGPPRFQP